MGYWVNLTLSYIYWRNIFPYAWKINTIPSMRKFYFSIALIIALTVAVWLARATFEICSWPTDSELAYIPAATHVFMTPYISDLHHSTLVQFNIMHGKEALVVAIAVFQHLLGDFEGLFPNILVLICATAGSSLLIFLILIRIVNVHAAFLGFLLFCTCFWSYQYILQGAHQPLVMFHCLLSIFLLLKFDGKGRWYLGSGLVMGLMLFSSPTAAIYIPYCLAAYIYQQRSINNGTFPWKKQLLSLSLISLGILIIIILFTIPHPVDNLKDFFKFLSESRSGNHFQVSEKALKTDLPKRGAGLIWIWKYFTLIMPVLFGAYLLSLTYLIKRSLRSRVLLWIIVLSFSTPILVELMQVAQFGRNYFSWFLGMLLTICMASDIFFKQQQPKKFIKGARALIACLIVTHVTFNFKIFVNDVFPSRMAVSYMHDWFAKNSSKQNYAYVLHPHNINTANVLNRPGEKNIISFRRVNSIADAKEGYMLIPMPTGKSIFLNCNFPDFSQDIYLTKLIDSGDLHKYVVATFPTMASSQIWPQEEEYCSYLDLVEKQITQRDRSLGHAWVLDLKKLHEEWFKDNL